VQLPALLIEVDQLTGFSQERVAALLGQHPDLEREDVCEFHRFSTSARGVDAQRDHHRDKAISRAYVTAYRDRQAWQTALKLRHALPPAVPVVVALSRPHGVAGLLDDVMKTEKTGSLVNIDVFSTMERTCTAAELVQGGSFELMADAIHERWRQEQRDAGKPDTTWEDLDCSRKESSRAQARETTEYCSVRISLVASQSPNRRITRRRRPRPGT
jgi:hypothetical protein